MMDIRAVFRPNHSLRESHVAIRGRPQKNGKRANLTLYFYKASGLTQAHSILIAIPWLKITTDMVANATINVFLGDQKFWFSCHINHDLISLIDDQ